MKIKKDYLKVFPIMVIVMVWAALEEGVKSEPDPESGNGLTVASAGPAVTSTVLAPTTISGNSGEAVTLIPYETLNLEANRVLDKLTLEIEVPLVDERLASKQELSALAKHLVGTPRHARTWVFFYLPGMEVDAGAYATAHYLPQPEGVKLVPLGLYNTDYEYLDPDLMEMRRAAQRARENPAAAAKERAQLFK